MRVIGGEFRSRRLFSPDGFETRPTPDRLREALFNILRDRLQDQVFVDAYAGTGSVGIEALSRGARQAVFLEKNRKAVETIRRNLEMLEIADRALVKTGSAHLALASTAADIVFIDPPYTREQEYTACFETLARNPPKILIVQHAGKFTAPDRKGALRRTRTVKQGDNALSFYEPEALTPN
jgi:16S rRNA (guanine(966)-N(2))-methyltransferase RsmD